MADNRQVGRPMTQSEIDREILSILALLQGESKVIITTEPDVRVRIMGNRVIYNPHQKRRKKE